jgi:hypothetical protein
MLLTYLLTYLPTPWCRILFEKLVFTQFVKNILSYVTRRFITVFTKACHWTLFPFLRSCQRINPGPRRFETFRNSKKFLRGVGPHAQPPSWRTTPYRLSATVYSIYLQLPSVPGGLPSNRNLRRCHAVVTRDPLNMVTYRCYCP